MALDTSLLSETAGLLRGNQMVAEKRDIANQESQDREAESKDRQITAVGNSIERAGLNMYDQAQQNKRQFINIDDTMVNGVKASYGDNAPLSKLTEQMKGKNVNVHWYSAMVANQSRQDIENLKSQHQMDLQKTKEDFSKPFTVPTKDENGKDVMQSMRLVRDDQGNIVPVPVGQGASKFNPNTGKDKKGEVTEKDLLAKRDSAAKSIRDFIAKYGTGEDGTFQFPSTGRKNQDIRTMLGQQVKNYTKYQEQLSKMGSAEAPDQDILDFSSRVMENGGKGSGTTKTPPPNQAHVQVGGKEFYIPLGNLDALKKDHPETVVLNNGQ